MYISGCGAFTDWKAQTDFFDVYPQLDYLKEQIEVLDEIPDSKPKPKLNIEEIKKKLKNIPQIYTKKFLLIQGGCDSFCTFCLTVKKRGRHYSRNMDDIIEDILEYELQWGKEVVLTWVNLTAWGLDSTNDIGKSRFAELLAALLAKTEIPRIRISSLWPEFITDEVIEILKNTRIYPHFHYSVQSGSSKTLKSMHRHYNWDHMRMLLEKTKNIKRDDWVEVSIGADLIVWFPGESQEDFMDTYNLVKDWLITKVHAFPFSAHNMWESVPAGKFPDQVDEKIKKERMWEIMNISDQIRDDFIDRNIWKEFQVLIENVIIEEGKTKWKGWTQNYIEADEKTFEITSGKIERNQIVTWTLI
jgi:MiaB/RimO family radical SAM methylthiotransferase